MSSVLQDELSNLTNDQLRSRLMQHGLGNMPVTSSTRQVLLGRLRKLVEGQKSAPRRETMHVTKLPTDADKVETKPGPASARKTTNRRNTVNAIPMTQEDVVPLAKSKNMRRSGRITPTLIENGNSAPIAVAPSENVIIETDEESVRETYVPPKRVSRSPSLGKSQTVVTSYKTEVAKPILIVESNEEDEDDDEDDEENYICDSNGQNNLYPSLPTNGFKILSPTKKTLQTTLRRTTTNTTAYEPKSYKSLHEQNYSDGSFKAPLSKPIVPTYTSATTSGLNRRYTSFTSQQKYDDDSATEHSDIDAPYLSDFAKRLSQLRPEPLDRKIIADVKQHYPKTDDSLWQSFSNLVIAFGRKFGTIFIAGGLLMAVVFIYVFFIMA